MFAKICSTYYEDIERNVLRMPACTSARRIDILLQHVPFSLKARLSRIERPGERSQTPHRQFVRLYAYYYEPYTTHRSATVGLVIR